MAQSEVQMQRKVQKYLRPDYDHAFSVRSTTDGQDEGGGSATGGGGSATGGGGSATSLITVTDRNQVVRRLHELREAQSETNLCYTLMQHRHQTQSRLLGELRRVQELLQVRPRPTLMAREDMLVVLAESSGASVQVNEVALDVGTGAGKGGGGDCDEWNGDDYCLNCDSECANGCGCGCGECVTEGKSACRATACSNLHQSIRLQCKNNNKTQTTTTTTTTASTTTSVSMSLIDTSTDTDIEITSREEQEVDVLVDRDESCPDEVKDGGARDDGGNPVSGLYQSEPYDHTLCSDCSVVCDLALDCVRRLGNMQVGHRCVDIFI